MPRRQIVTLETVRRMSDELIRAGLAEQDFQAIADLLSALSIELAPLRTSDLEREDPATQYQADDDL